MVGAASEEGSLVVNGMSNHARNGKNANCAVAVSVFPSDIRSFMDKDTDSPILAAINFQRMLERRAYSEGGGNYFAPVQLMGDFLGGTTGAQPKRIMPTYMGGRVNVGDINNVLPSFVTDELKRGFHIFDKRIKGFAAPDVPLTAVESRTTSPIRILRNGEMFANGHPCIFPCGEGAGYAGGITSAAVDGLRCAEAVIRRFAPSEG